MKKRKLGLSTKILISLVIGIVVGIIVFHFVPEGNFKDKFLISGVFNILGQVFLRSIMMIVVPLVFVSLVNGAASMGDIQKLGRVGGKTILFYLGTTAVAVVIALVLGMVIKPGGNLDLSAIETVEVSAVEAPSIIDTLINMIPKNAIKAMADGDMLPIIVFAIVVGIGISLLGERAARIKVLFEDLNELMMKLIEMVMVLAPVGVFGLIAKTFGEIGISALIPLAKYVIAIYIGLFLHGIFVYGGLLKGLTGLPLGQFYKKFFPAMTVAFSTASSAATLPVSLDICENDLGVSRDIAAFTIPLGNTINMDGTAIMQGIATLFVAQVYGITLTFTDMLTVVLTATLASVGTAGVPGAGAIMLSMVLQSIGLPLEGMGLIMGIDRLVDMGRTTLNVTGDAVCTVIIAKQEKELNEEVFLSEVSKERKKAKAKN